MLRAQLAYWSGECLDLVFPQICPVCSCHRVVRGGVMCLHCLVDLPLTGEAHIEDNRTEQHFYGRVRVRAAASLMYFYPYGAAQRLLHNVKYKGARSLARSLGRMLGRYLEASPRFESIDCIVPVPLHARKLRSRGYNQSALISNGVAEYLGTEVVENIIRRVRHTASQTAMTRSERLSNVDGAFEFNQRCDPGCKHILVVDDVITTGATIEACVREIKSHMHTDVSVATVASGRL